MDRQDDLDSLVSSGLRLNTESVYERIEPVCEQFSPAGLDIVSSVWLPRSSMTRKVIC